VEGDFAVIYNSRKRQYKTNRPSDLVEITGVVWGYLLQNLDGSIIMAN